jgi:LysR family glycine cleavage system transcriptional activator
MRDETAARPLRMTTTNAFAHRWLVPRLPSWRRAHPRIALEVIGTDALLDLAAGDADLAIRYARLPPPGHVVEELFRGSFVPVCAPAVLASGRPIREPTDLTQHTLIHMHWQPWESCAPTWRRWLAAACAPGVAVPEPVGTGALTFREELHAIEAAIAGEGIVIVSDLLVGRELESGALVRAFEFALPGFGFYLTHLPGHPRQAAIAAFSAWIRSVA